MTLIKSESLLSGFIQVYSRHEMLGNTAPLADGTISHLQRITKTVFPSSLLRYMEVKIDSNQPLDQSTCHILNLCRATNFP